MSRASEVWGITGGGIRVGFGYRNLELLPPMWSTRGSLAFVPSLYTGIKFKGIKKANRTVP